MTALENSNMNVVLCK